jgi:D-alanyl-D-alanine carboxypeptidase
LLVRLVKLAVGACSLLPAACIGPVQSRDPRVALDAQLAENSEQHGIPAQAVLVLRNGQVLYRNQTGLADIEMSRAVRPDDIYPVYSVAKLFVSTLILELADQHRLELDQPASRYVAGLPATWRDVRIDQLLNHTSGLPDLFDSADGPFPPTRDDVFRTLGAKPLVFAPGSEQRYTQTNYLVLQAVLEALHGAPYREIVRTRITEPLGMRNTYLGLSHAPRDRLVSPYRGENGRIVRDRKIAWQDYSIAHAELFTTPEDLGNFLTAVARGRYARPEMLTRVWQPSRLVNGELTSFASGWDYDEADGLRAVGHDGGVKVRVRLIFRSDDLSDHHVIVYLTNGTRDGVWTRRLVESVQRIVLRSAVADMD